MKDIINITADFTDDDNPNEIVKKAVSLEKRKVFKRKGIVKYHGDRKLPEDFINEDEVLMGCTIDGLCIIAKTDFTNAIVIGYF